MADFIEAQIKYLSSKGYKFIISYESVDITSDGWVRYQESKYLNIAYNPIDFPEGFNYKSYNMCLDYTIDVIFEREFSRDMNNE